MTLDLTVTISDIIAITALIIAGLSSFFAIIQWRNSVAIKRAEYINDLTEKIRSDVDIRNVIYMIDYGTDWYSPDFHGSGELERKVDKTLSYFSYIVYLREGKIISKREFRFFLYEIERLLVNGNIRDYLYNLYHFSNRAGTPCTFTYLIEYGRKYYPNLFDTDFFDSKICERNSKDNPARNGMIYHKNLNF